MDTSENIKTGMSEEALQRKTVKTEPDTGNEHVKSNETGHVNTDIILQHPLPIKTEPGWQIKYIQLTKDQLPKFKKELFSPVKPEPSHGMGTESSQGSIRQSLDVKTENPDGTIGQLLEVKTHNGHDGDSEDSTMQIEIEPGSVRSLDIKFEHVEGNVNDDEDKAQPEVLNCRDEIKTEMGDDSAKRIKIEPGSSLGLKLEGHRETYLQSADNIVIREDEMQTDYVVKQEPGDADDDVPFISLRSCIDDDNIDAAAAKLEMRMEYTTETHHHVMPDRHTIYKLESDYHDSCGTGEIIIKTELALKSEPDSGYQDAPSGATFIVAPNHDHVPLTDMRTIKVSQVGKALMQEDPEEESNLSSNTSDRKVGLLKIQVDDPLHPVPHARGYTEHMEHEDMEGGAQNDMIKDEESITIPISKFNSMMAMMGSIFDKVQTIENEVKAIKETLVERKKRSHTETTPKSHKRLADQDENLRPIIKKVARDFLKDVRYQPVTVQGMVNIGNEETTLFVKADKYSENLKKAKGPEGFMKGLLRQVFTIEELQNGSVAGGERRLGREVIIKKRLDANKIRIIRSHVKEIFTMTDDLHTMLLSNEPINKVCRFEAFLSRQE